MEVDNIDQKIISIMEFLSNYDDDISMQSLFSGTSFYKLLLEVGETSFDFTCNLETNTTKWWGRFLNFEAIVDKICEYFQKVEQKFLQISFLDLIELCKKDSMEKLVQFFQILMCLVMDSPNKDIHIQNIIKMRESSQQCFVPIIKNALDSKIFSETKVQRNKYNILKRMITEFEEEKIEMQNQTNRLFHANIDLLGKVEEQNAVIEQIKEELNQKNSQRNLHIQDSSNIEHLSEIIEKLKQKMKRQIKEHEEEKIRFNTKIQQYEQKIMIEEETGEMNEIYKEKYEEIMDQMQKMNTWKKQKAKMEKTMDEKNFAIQKLHERIEELSERNIILEEKQLDLNLQIEQKNIKIKKLSEDLKKAIGTKSHHFNCEGSISLDHSVSFKENVSFLADEQQEMSKLRKNNEKIMKQNRNQKKQILKLQKKCQRLRILQEDRRRLEVLVYQLRTTQSQELNLLTSVFIEGYMDTIEIKRNLKHYTLNISDKLDAQIRKRSSSSDSLQKNSFQQLERMGKIQKFKQSSFKDIFDEIIQ